MREIKFRAWFHKEDELARMIYFGGPDYCDEYNHLSFSLKKESCNPNESNYSNLCAGISDMEVMQFTGLKDKNGKEIYEGDVLSQRDGANGAVTFGQWKLGDGLVYGWFIVTAREYPVALFDGFADLEVIGNIHETPELLKEAVGSSEL